MLPRLTAGEEKRNADEMISHSVPGEDGAFMRRGLKFLRSHLRMFF